MTWIAEGVGVGTEMTSVFLLSGNLLKTDRAQHMNSLLSFPSLKTLAQSDKRKKKSSSDGQLGFFYITYKETENAPADYP